ncbi:hypothetical protein HZU75_14495 [Chitinibacter fontanus]|uniref:Replication initiation factor domain-containing protein n=1 Tax=Chitinibacter fontanus TaxID=1737446 RepID=A0A7D5VB11_9NEIS|nr:hypothetical protein [Chitinibacter fontanus]QLI82639.1 hypothetical protein HZU75_14495 [Chitinibacter fontanus]
MSTNAKRSTTPRKNKLPTSKPSRREIDDEIDDLGNDPRPTKSVPSKAKPAAKNLRAKMRSRCSIDKIRLAFPIGESDVEVLAANLESHMVALKEDGISERKSSTGEAYKQKYWLESDGGRIWLLAHPKSDTAKYFLEIDFSFGKADASGEGIKLIRGIIDATYYEHAADALAGAMILNMELAVDIDRPFSSLLFACKSKHAFEVWGKEMSANAETIQFGSRASERYFSVYDLQAAELDDLAYPDFLQYRKNKQLPADFDDYYPKARKGKPMAQRIKVSADKTMPESIRIECRYTRPNQPLSEVDSLAMEKFSAIQIYDMGNFERLCATLEQKLFLELAKCMGVSAVMSKLVRKDKERYQRLLDQAKFKEWEQINIAKDMAKALRELRLAFTQ